MANRCQIACLVLLLAGGCANAVSVGQNTALDGTDLVRMTDDMAAAIEASPAVQTAFARDGSLTVVVEPVVNRLTAEVLTPGVADAFTGRVRTLLAHHDAPGQQPARFTWVMNRDAFYRLRQQELQGVDPGPAPDAVSPRYALTATFTSLAHETDAGRTDYYVCNYTLTDLSTRGLLWTRSYEVQKRAVSGFLD